MRACVTATFLLFLRLYTTVAAPTPPRSAEATLPSDSPSSSSSSSSSSASTLDPAQLRALQFLRIPTTQDPCTTMTTSQCDTATPYRHLLSLRLTNCSSDHRLSTTTLSALSTLTTLTFIACHTTPVHFPSSLSANLRSFTSINSLQRLTGVFLSHFRNLNHLYISGDPIKASGVHIIISNMKSLKTITLYNTHLNGYLPKDWNLINPKLTYIDFSKNKLKGTIPMSLTLLKNLKVLNFSSNNINGVLPNSFGTLTSLKKLSLSSNSISGPIPASISAIEGLVHLNLGSNQFNGVIPEFLSEMKELKYLNLENNKFHGVLPFNASFITRLDVFKIGGNEGLCYNHSIGSLGIKLGIAPCDKHGMPILPPPMMTNATSFSAGAAGDGGGGSGDGSDDDDVEKKDQVNVNRGANKVVLGMAIALSAMVFIVIFLILLFIC